MSRRGGGEVLSGLHRRLQRPVASRELSETERGNPRNYNRHILVRTPQHAPALTTAVGAVHTYRSYNSTFIVLEPSSPWMIGAKLAAALTARTIVGDWQITDALVVAPETGLGRWGLPGALTSSKGISTEKAHSRSQLKCKMSERHWDLPLYTLNSYDS